MTDAPEAGADSIDAARESLRETLDHIEQMEGSGIWGLLALVVGLVLKGLLWQAARTHDDPAAGEDDG